MDRLPPWVRVLVGLLIALAGVRGVMQYDSLWLKVLFALVVASGLFNAAMARPRRTVS